MSAGRGRFRRWGSIAGVLSVPLALVALLLMVAGVATARLEGAAATNPVLVQPPLTAETQDSAQNSVANNRFVFRFDPVLESFEVFTIPTNGSNPYSIDVIDNGTGHEVWFTEPDADKLRRLVYTATQDYEFHEYPVNIGSRPLDLVVDNIQGMAVWFTELDGNRIGRLEIGSGDTYTHAEFNIDTPDSRPAGIDLAPDGSVWFTEIAADKIGHLMVNTPFDYHLQEYPIDDDDVVATGIEVQSNQYIWFGEMATGKVKRLNAASGSLVSVGLLPQGPEVQPFDLLYDSGRDYLWVTEFGDDQVSQIQLTTLTIVNSYDVPPPGGTPRGLTKVGNNHFWFAEYASGLLGRMVYTSADSVHFDAFRLPVKGLFVSDVVADDGGALWVIASEPQHKAHLPLLTRDHNPSLPQPFGVQMYGRVSNDTGLTELSAVGVRWIRVPFSWRYVEPIDTTPDQYQWGVLDAQVAGVTGAGIEPLLTLAGNPNWAAVYPMGPVTDVTDLQEFLGAVVERYDGDGINDAPGSPVVRYWEIYNEPDNGDEWRAIHGGYSFFGRRGDEYAALLDALYPVIKAANRDAQVVFGGVAADNFSSGFDPDFTDEVLASCTGRCFDVMNFHYFPVYRPEWEPFGRDIIGKAQFFKSKLASHGFARPIMCTETTWVSGSTWGSPELQARYVIAVLVRGMASELVLTNWFAWKDIDSGLPGLLDADLAPKPALDAYRTLTDQMNGAVFERALSSAQTGDVDIEGYVFSVSKTGGKERRDVVWLDCPSFKVSPIRDCPDESRTMTVAAGTVRVTYKFGEPATVSDGDDGRVDGLVNLTITSDPVFIDYTP